MKRKRLAEEQIIGVLLQSEAGAKIADLTLLICRRGKPGMIGAEWYYIAPGRPIQHGYVGSFKGAARGTNCSTRRCS